MGKDTKRGSLSAVKTNGLKARDLQQQLRALENPPQAAFLAGFFKTGPGQYAEGDIFLGLKVPVVRELVREFRGMEPAEALKLVRSKYHEERLAGLLLWVAQFEKGDPETRRVILDLYLANTQWINNWDLVDLTAPQIVGGSVAPEAASLLDRLAGSNLLWERRIAVLATHKHIRQGVFGPTLRLCERLLADKHDLMHKACGWMLREVGKRDRAVLSRFLDAHASVMPRTMLRYALEHYPEQQRRHYMERSGSKRRSISG